MTVRARLLSVLLLVVLLAGSVTTTMLLRKLVHDQNRDLLHERTAEAGLVLSSSMTSIKPTLQVLGATYSVDPSGLAANALVHQYASAAGTLTAIASLEKGRFVVRDAAGPGVAANTALTGARAALAQRAVATKDLVTDVTFGSNRNEVRLTFAVALPNGVVVLEDVKLDPAQLTQTSGTSPFSELRGAVYAAPSEQASKLLFTNATKLPLRGMIDRQTFNVGADRWFLVTSARHALVGSFASTAPWIVLVLGVLISIFAFAAADVLIRRRAYALALVDERTSALRCTMADLESARCAAEAANRAKSEFLSRMSHELRTPLNAVLGFAQVLELGALTAAQQQSVTQISKGGHHLLELINDVLDISRIETGNLTLSPEPVLIEDVVGDVIDLVEPLADQRDIRCDIVAGPDNGSYVLADRQRLKQVLLNLLSNAVKYNKEGGSVIVSAERRESTRVRINVTDTGPGIPADRLPQLFQPFERLGAENTNVEGAGIGLALSRRLAEAMGGVVDATSSERGGSTFWIELQLSEGPVERHQRTSANAPIVATGVAPESPRHTVLYIEDNLANIKLIEHVLDYRRDVNLITAMQGRLGVELAVQHRPDLVLLDLHLPDIGGEAVLAELRAKVDTAAVPVIVLTADATERQHARLISAGATAYVTKPIDVRQLLELVDQQLAHPATKLARQT